jgi:hypothetical protein
MPGTHAIVRPQRNPIEWRVCVTRVQNQDGSAADGTNAIEFSAGEIEGRKQARAFFEFLRRDVPGFSHSYIVDLPPQLGIRETRRIVGEYRLSEDDVITCASFDDTVGAGALPLDNPIAGETRWNWPDIASSRGFYHLPYRMLLPQGVRNLLVAGRCASLTHEGQVAARASGSCFVMGQAAGSAAHLALKDGKDPRDVAPELLQAVLEADGAYLGRGQDAEAGRGQSEKPERDATLEVSTLGVLD